MNKYIARLNAKIRETALPHELPKLTEGSGLASSIRQTTLPHVLTKLPKDRFDSFGSDGGSRVSESDGPPGPDEVKIEERKGMAMDSVPEPYLDGWARLQCQRPPHVPEEAWRQVIDDAGRFLDRLAKSAIELGWTAAGSTCPAMASRPASCGFFGARMSR